jgi:hypothetical protein
MQSLCGFFHGFAWRNEACSPGGNIETSIAIGSIGLAFIE